MINDNLGQVPDGAPAADDDTKLFDSDELASVTAMQTGEGQHTILVEGDIDIATAPRLNADIQAAFQAEVNELIVDLREVTFIDSTGLGVLVGARKRARSSGAHLKLMLPEGQARFPFEVTGLASMFDTHDDNPKPTAG